jgi:hypothetical protein
LIRIPHRANVLADVVADVQPHFLPARLLEARQAADTSPTLWHTFNKVQQATMAGGLTYRTDKDRLIRTRRVHSIREDVRVNCALWQAAVEMLN